jgi:hypothetical protein
MGFLWIVVWWLIELLQHIRLSVVDCCEVNRDEYSPTTGLLSFAKL